MSNQTTDARLRKSCEPTGRHRYTASKESLRHYNHEKTIQMHPGTVCVREAFVLRSIEVYPWFNDLVTVLMFKFFVAFTDAVGK